MGGQATVNEAQAALATAQAEQNVGLHPFTPAQLAAAQAAVAQDLATISATNSKISQAQLRAPFSGIVAQVNGAIGDLASPQGVKQPSSPSGVPTQPGSGIAIFPQAPSGSTQQTPEFASMLTLNSTGARVVAQVSETDITKVKVGDTATITFPAIPGYTYTGVVRHINPTAIDQNGTAFYLVDLVVRTSNPKSSTGGGGTSDPLPAPRVGLTADVSF